MTKLIFYTIHGIGKHTKPDYPDNFHAEIAENLSPIYREKVVFARGNWSVLVEQRQKETWEMEADLWYSGLRKEIISLACDILWYAKSKNTASGRDIYTQIHSKTATELASLKEQHGKDSKIVLFGHSLGSQIALDHCFETEDKIDALFTAGSPITKFSGSFPDWGHLPKKGLDFFENFYSPADLVSSSFRKHKSKEFSEFVVDHEVVTLKMRMMYPARVINALIAHSEYWNNGGVHKAIAGRLESYMAEVCR